MHDMSLYDVDELEKRMKELLDELDVNLKELGPLLERVGRVREEIAVIDEELIQRSGKTSDNREIQKT